MASNLESTETYSFDQVNEAGIKIKNRRKGTKGKNVKSLVALGPKKVVTYKNSNKKPNDSVSDIKKGNFVLKCIENLKKCKDDWPYPSHDTIINFTERIVEGKEKMARKELISVELPNLMERFDVKKEDDGYKLIWKKPHAGKKVIDMYKCFDLIHDAHEKTNHGTHMVTVKALKLENPDVYIPDIAIQNYIILCDDCKSKNYLERKDYYFRKNKAIESIHNHNKQLLLEKEETSRTMDAEMKSDTLNDIRLSNRVVGPNYSKTICLDITAMDISDGIYNFLLIYLQLDTRYVLLRPLSTLGLHDITIELFKIFADFGEPNEVHTSIRMVEISKKLRNNLNIVGFKIVFSQTMPSSFDEFLPSTIKKSLNRWCKYTKSNNWSVGCYDVQRVLNKKKHNNLTPFDELFGKTKETFPVELQFEEEFIVSVSQIDDLQKELTEKTLNTYDDEDSLDAFREPPCIQSDTANIYNIPSVTNKNDYEKSFEYFAKTNMKDYFFAKEWFLKKKTTAKKY